MYDVLQKNCGEEKHVVNEQDSQKCLIFISYYVFLLYP